MESQIIDCYDAKSQNLIRFYDSIMEASRQTGVAAPNIIRCCNKEAHTAGGYIWRRHGAPLDVEPQKVASKSKPVVCYLPINLECPLMEFASVNDAAKYYGTTASRIAKSCNDSYFKVKGLLWRYKGTPAPKSIVPKKDLELTLHVPIYQIDPRSATLVRKWFNAASIPYNRNTKNGVKRATVDGVLACCQGLIEEHAGYIWQYAQEPKGIKSIFK